MLWKTFATLPFLIVLAAMAFLIAPRARPGALMQLPGTSAIVSVVIPLPLNEADAYIPGVVAKTGRVPTR